MKSETKEKSNRLFAGFLAFLLVMLAIFAITPHAFAEEVDELDTATEEAPTDGQTAFSEEITRFLDAHAGELFSGLSLLGTLLLAFFYRKGLLPTLQSGLGSVSNGVEQLTARAGEIGEGQDRKLAAFFEKAAPLLDRLSAFGELAENLERKTEALRASLENEKEEREALKVLSVCSTEMLKEVFTAAKLPAASKEELERIWCRAKDALDGDAAEDKR